MYSIQGYVARSRIYEEDSDTFGTTMDLTIKVTHGTEQKRP